MRKLFPLALILAACAPRPEVRRAVEGPGYSVLSQAEAVLVVRGDPNVGEAATGNRQLVQNLAYALREGMTDNPAAEARSQSAEGVQGEVTFFAFPGGRRKRLWTFRFDPQEFKTPRYRQPFIDAVREVAKKGEPFADYMARRDGATQAEIDAVHDKQNKELKEAAVKFGGSRND